MTDRERLLALLASLPDVWPEPETWTGRMQRRALVERRPAPRRKLPCELCEGRGRLHSLRPCQACGGDLSTGAPGRGFRVIDDYTGTEVAASEAEAKAMMVEVRCDSCTAGWMDAAKTRRCVRCSGSGRVLTSDWRRIDALLDRPEIGATDGEEYLLDVCTRREAQGSYAELERALSVLLAQSPLGWRLVMRSYVWGLDGLTPAAVAQRDRALGWLEAMMPRPIRLPAYLERPLVRGGPKRRREAVVALLEEGVEMAEVIRRSGLSRARVYELRAQLAADRVVAA